MSREIKIEGKYTVFGGLGCWVKSTEWLGKPQKGDCRVIDGVLMHIRNIYLEGYLWRRWICHWTPVDDNLNTSENISAFKQGLKVKPQ